MTEREIRIGDTESFRYIGVKPPLSELSAGAVMKIVGLPKWMIAGIDDSYNQNPTGATPENLYTEFGYYIGAAEDLYGKSHVNNVAIVLACQVAKILEQQGDTVTLDTTIVPTDFQTPMFDERADRMREINRRFAARRKE